jgi:hypothetical protein
LGIETQSDSDSKRVEKKRRAGKEGKVKAIFEKEKKRKIKGRQAHTKRGQRGGVVGG